MNRPTLITLAVTGIACCAVLIAQASKNRTLKGEAESKRQAITKLEQELRRIDPLTSLGGAARPMPPVHRSNTEEAIAKSRASIPSAERVVATRKRIELLVAEIGEMKRSPAEFFRILPDILRVIHDLSIDEMIEVAAGIEAPNGMRSPDGKAVTRMVLLLLAAEHDPLRVIENSDLKAMEDNEMRNSLLGQLSKHDPKAAREWVENSDLGEDEKKRFNSLMAVRLLRNNVQEGLELVRELKSETAGGTSDLRDLAMMPFPPEKIPDLIAALGDERNDDLRPELVGMILRSSAISGGVAATREVAEKIELSGEELNNYFNTNFNETLSAEPEAALAWMDESLDAEGKLRTIPNSIANWARKDFNAAGEYLGKMEASAIKDQAIHRFAQTVDQVDPEAAAVWAMQIEDENLRNRSILSVSSQWRGRDQERAEAWLEENGYDANGHPIEDGEP